MRRLSAPAAALLVVLGYPGQADARGDGGCQPPIPTGPSSRPDLQQARERRAQGETLMAQGRMRDAGECFAAAIDAAVAAEDRDEAARSRLLAGRVHYAEGRPEEARALWNLARADFVAGADGRGEFDVLEALAISYPGIDRRPFLERAFDIGREQNDTLLQARARARWTQALLHAGRPGPALIEIERAAAQIRELGPGAEEYLPDTLSTLAWALRAHGANERAVLVHQEAIQLARRRNLDDALIWNYYGLGVTLVELKRFGEAEIAMRQSRDIARKSGSATTIRTVAGSEGYLALKQGHWREAATALEATMAMPGVELSAMTFTHLSDAYRNLGDLDKAVEWATRGVEVARRLGLDDNELRNLVALAQAQEARGNQADAESTLQTIVDRLETYRASLAPIDFLKQGFAERFTDAYGAMVSVLMARGRPGDALAAAERLRGRAFADLLQGRRLRERDQAEVGDWLLGVEPHGVGPVAASDSPVIAPSLDANALIALAKRLSTTIVAYWIQPRDSYAWVVAPDGAVHGTRLAVDPDRLRRTIRRAVDVPPTIELTATGATARSGSLAAYRQLHAELWAPIAQWLPATRGSRVTVIPHGPLFACPFAALRDARGQYLVERFTLHYAGSGAVLLEALERATPASIASRALIVADPAGARRNDQLASLPAARREARAIERTLAMPSDVLVGEAASEQRVRELLPAASLAHFATHALVRDDDPLGSHLVLGRVGAGPDLDGELSASEVAAMTTLARVVVLGACRSARGPVSSDGIAGLTRAFMAAGAPSVVAALWDVVDEPTSRLMRGFYRAYADGRPRDEALRSAQLAVLHDLRAGRIKTTAGGGVAYPEHPWLWAGAILVGAP